MLGRSRHLHRDPGIGRFSIAKTQSRQSPMWTQWTPPKKLKNMAICFLHPIYGNTCSYFFHAYERACAMKYFIHMHANTCKYLHIHTKWSDLLGHLVGRMVDSWLILESDGVLFLWSCEFQPHPVPHQQIPIEKTREGLETLGFPGHLAKSHGFSTFF